MVTSYPCKCVDEWISLVNVMRELVWLNRVTSYPCKCVDEWISLVNVMSGLV